MREKEWMQNLEGEVLPADYLRETIRILSSSMNDYLFLYDFEEDLYTLSPKAVERFCVPSSQFHNLGQKMEQFVFGEDLPLLREDIADICASDRTTHDLLYRWLSTDGKPIWINCRGTVVRRDGKAIYMTGCINEVGRTQQADNRSGLLGTYELRKQVEQHLPELKEGFFLRIGLDDMKSIAARFGMEYAEQLTSAVASFIVQSCTANQDAYRLDGDEFMVVDFSGGTVENARRLYGSVQDMIAEMMAQSHYKVLLTISAGVVTAADVMEPSFSAIMRQSDFILGEAQRKGPNTFCVYSGEAYRRFIKYRQLRLQLFSAVEHDFTGFEVYYQPVYAVDSRRISSAEALLRFHSELHGMISPTEFIPILEETGLIVPVGRWVLREACRACLRIQRLVPDFHMSINVSPVQIMRSHFWQDLITIIQEEGVNPDSIICELTESAELEQDSHSMNSSRQIHASKVRLALDDFGSGYSNFRYLTDLMPNVIKVDRLFTSKAAVDPFEFRLLSVFSEMAHTMGTELVVEGVENETELEAAYLVSADYIQGFYFSKPQPFANLLKMLEDGIHQEQSVQFPKLLYDQYFVSDVLAEDIFVMTWVNLETGMCRSMKKRTPLPLPDETIEALLSGIQKMDILHPMDRDGLNRFLNLEYLNRAAKEGQTKLAYRARMKVRGDFEWILAEVTIPTTYSAIFPYALLTWRKADAQFCIQQEAFRLRNADFYRILQVDLLKDRFVEVTIADGMKSTEKVYRDRAMNWLNTFALNGGIHPEDVEGYRSFIDPNTLRKRFLAGEKRLIFNCRRKHGGEYRWVKLDWIPCREFSEQDQLVMLYVLDIHETFCAKLEEHRKMEEMATMDCLTGLRNRYHFMQWCRQLAQTDGKTSLGVLYADLNCLKIINDTQGHRAGDDHIRQFAELLRKLFPDRVSVRMSGDEFLTLFSGVEEASLIRAAQQLRDAGQTDGLPMAAVGWAWSGGCANVDDLVNEAERRMYADKRASKALRTDV